MNAVSDPYWSRRGEAWEAADRVDPVVHPGVDGPLSAAQVASFDRDGFVVLPGWLPEDAVQAALSASTAAADARPGADEVIAEPDSDVVRSLFAVHELAPTVGGLCRDPRLAGVARQLLGSDVYVHQSRVNWKPALDGKEFFWHSDFETWHVEDGMPRMRAVSASILLTASSEFNGPLLLVPGSHKTYVRTVGETPPEHHKLSLRKQEIGVPSAEALAHLVDRGGMVSATGAPGTVVFFDCNTMHGSSGNLSPWPRINLFFVYNSVHNALVDPFSGMPPRPGYIAAREPKPLARA